jgi:hypothetical protein
MGSPFQRLIRGSLVIVGKEPDGDSVRFVADDPGLYDELQHSHRIRPSGDGSVQLRFESIDAPELHYGSEAQPLGLEARDRLLELIGFADIGFGDDSTVVTEATPESVRAAILSEAAEANGRPVSYVLLEEEAPDADDGTWLEVDAALLDRTLNRGMLAEGLAYYTVYSSTPVAHRRHLHDVTRGALQAGGGVAERDVTAEFTLDDQASIGPDGQLILPKLFRRCTDYLAAVTGGFVGNLADWLRATSGGSRDENDRLVLGGRTELRLADLLVQRNNRIAFQADLLDVVFIEK